MGTAEAAAAAPLVAVVAREQAMRRALSKRLRCDCLEVAAANHGGWGDLPAVDVVVMHLPRGSTTFRELRSLLRARPATRAVCVCAEPAWKAVRALLREGATAVVAEEEIDATLVPAVRSALAGQLSVPSRLRSDIAQPVLSVREKQMLAMVVMGFSNPEIAHKLFVAESTVKSHLSSAFAKLGVRTRNEATALILDPAHGLGTGILEISGDARPIAGTRPPRGAAHANAA